MGEEGEAGDGVCAGGEGSLSGGCSPEAQLTTPEKGSQGQSAEDSDRHRSQVSILDRQTDRQTDGNQWAGGRREYLRGFSIHPCSWGFFSHCWRLPSPQLLLRPSPPMPPCGGGDRSGRAGGASG